MGCCGATVGLTSAAEAPAACPGLGARQVLRDTHFTMPTTKNNKGVATAQLYPAGSFPYHTHLRLSWAHSPTSVSLPLSS